MTGPRKGVPEDLDDYRPPSPAQDRIFRIVWGLFQITTWASVVVATHPRLLDHVGGDALADWIIGHTALRWITAPFLFIALVLSMFQPISMPRRGSRPGTPGAQPHWKPDPTYGSPLGQALEVSAGPWTVDVRAWTRDHKRVTVASARVRLRKPLSFVLRGRGLETDLLGGIQQAAMDHAIRRLEEEKPTAAEALSFLAEPPVPIGQDSLDRRAVLRTTDPDLARRALSTADVVHALRTLHLTSKQWTWSLMVEEGDMAEMRLERPGRGAGEETVRELTDVMRAGLGALAAVGVVEGE